MKKTIITILSILIGTYILINNGLLSKKQNIGSFTTSNGIIADGEFKNKVLISGSITLPNGEKYIGKFSNNLLHGEGMIILSEGSKINGVFENGKIKGLGINTFNTGNMNYTYIGGLNSGDATRKGNGISILSIQSGEDYPLIYIGDFKDHEKNGFGSYFIGTISTYVGEFKNGKYNGKGSMIINGNAITGEFLNDKLITIEKETPQIGKKEKKNENTLSKSKEKILAENNEKEKNKKELSKNDTICQRRLTDILNRAKYLSILYGYLENSDKYESAYNSLNNKNNWLSKIIYNEWDGNIQYVDNWCRAMQSSFTTISIQDVCGNMSQEVLNTEKKVNNLCYRN